MILAGVVCWCCSLVSKAIASVLLYPLSPRCQAQFCLVQQKTKSKVSEGKDKSWGDDGLLFRRTRVLVCARLQDLDDVSGQTERWRRDWYLGRCHWRQNSLHSS